MSIPKQKRRILVAGGAGFIGSHLCDRLLDQGHYVVAIDNLVLGRRSNLSLAMKSDCFTFVEQDILDFDALSELFRCHQFQTVFHLAANSDIQAGSHDPNRDLDMTFRTTFNVLLCMRDFEVRELVFTSSSAIYGRVDSNITEDHGPLRPESFYGAAKLSAEAFISSFVHVEHLRAWIARFPNVVGERATHGVIYDFVQKLRKNPSELRILGDGNQCKPYMYVHDLVDALLFCYEKMSDVLNFINIGVQTTTTVRRIAEIVVEEMNLDNVRFRFSGGEGGWIGDIPRFQYDLTRLTNLGWTPRYSSDEAVHMAVRELLKQI